jgi:Domain of unknown function (DUF2382)
MGPRRDGVRVLCAGASRIGTGDLRFRKDPFRRATWVSTWGLQFGVPPPAAGQQRTVRLWGDRTVQDRTIDVTTHREEPDVAKETRLKEEVSSGKKPTAHRDCARHRPTDGSRG